MSVRKIGMKEGLEALHGVSLCSLEFEKQFEIGMLKQSERKWAKASKRDV